MRQFTDVPSNFSQLSAPSGSVEQRLELCPACDESPSVPANKRKRGEVTSTVFPQIAMNDSTILLSWPSVVLGRPGILFSSTPRAEHQQKHHAYRQGRSTSPSLYPRAFSHSNSVAASCGPAYCYSSMPLSSSSHDARNRNSSRFIALACLQIVILRATSCTCARAA